jgi:DivIVA domain-containing protein
MIDLTPLEVRKKKGDFRKGMRGYDPQAVDDFLDLVADRLEQLVRENSAMNDQFARLENQVNDYRERERALTEALVTAQEMREEMRKQIEKEVELKRREAEADADSIRAEAEQIRHREHESIRRLRARQAQFILSYRAFLERELAELSVMAESLELNRNAPANAQTRKQRNRPGTASQMEKPQKREPQRPPAAEPQPMPLPVAVPEPPIATQVQTPWEREGGPAAIEQELPFKPSSAPDPASSVDRSFDELLDSLPAFAGDAHVRQINKPDTAPIEPQVDADEEAEVLADVRSEFDELVAEDLPPLPEQDEELLDLVDDVADDEDEDGWMSTLLEGKGDKRS